MLKRGRLPSSCWAAPASPPFSDQIKMKTSPGLQMKTKRSSGLKSLQEWKGPDQWKVSKEEWKGQSQRKKSLRSEGHLQRYWEGFGWGCCLCLQCGYRRLAQLHCPFSPLGVLWTGVHIPECVWLSLQVQTFYKGMDQEEEEKSEEGEENVFE